MTDIVERLRALQVNEIPGGQRYLNLPAALAREAADEIERLRNKLFEIADEIEIADGKLLMQNERLRAEKKEVADEIERLRSDNDTLIAAQLRQGQEIERLRAALQTISEDDRWNNLPYNGKDEWNYGGAAKIAQEALRQERKP